jgi:hypothetical protein
MIFDAQDAELLRPLKFSMSAKQTKHMLDFLNARYDDFLKNKSWFSFQKSVELGSSDVSYRKIMTDLNCHIGKSINLSFDEDRRVQLTKYKNKKYRSELHSNMPILIQ